MNRMTRTLWLLSAATTALATPLAARAQEAPPAGGEDSSIVITGSRLPSTDLTGSAPVTVLDRSDIDATGTQSVGELLRDLPVASAASSDTAGRGNDGSANVALRGLSAVNTLVLINGRRVLPNTAGGTVDLNSIPFEAIDRMEVLQDGASAVYGSDAIAGVVNIITRKSYDGVLLKGGYGISSRGDLPNRELSGTFGKTYATGGFVFNLSYRHAGGNRISDRPISRDPDWRSLGGRNFRDSAPVTSSGLKGLTVPGADPSTIYILKDGATDPSKFSNYRPALFPDVFTAADGVGNDGINYWDYESSAADIKQLNAYLSGEKEVAPGIKAFVEASYSQRKSKAFLAPNYFDGNLVVGANNIYNPFGTPLTVYRTIVEQGTGVARTNNVDSKTYRIVAGFEGEIGSSWKWDLSGNYQRLDQYTDAGRGIVRARMQHAVSDACNTDPSCVPVNLFGPAGSVTQAMIDSVSADNWRDINAEMKSVVGNVSGKLFALPAGDVNLAMGGEYRTESFSQHQDDAADYDTRQPPFTPPTRKVAEVYAETALPLLRDLPFVYRLDLEGAVRYSHYNQFGSTTNPKLGVKWRPYRDLLVRGSWGTGFRAPTFTEANSTQTRTYRPVVDPCQSVEYGAFPGCNGVRSPVTTGAFVVSGANPALKPEKARNLTIGAVWTPSFVPRLALTLDYYRIKKTNIIGTADANYILAQNAAGTGFASAVMRNPDNSILEVSAIRDNLLSLTLKGLDFGIEYATAPASWGTLHLRGDVTYMDSYKLPLSASSAPIEQIDTYTTALGTLAHWRGNGRLTWTLGGFSVSYAARYVGPVTNLASFAVDGAYPRARSYLQHDLALVYNMKDEKMKFTLAVENLTNRMPPFLEGNYQNGFDQMTFNSRGRYMSLRVEKGF